MRRFALAVLILSACDPEVGSLADCEPGAAPAALDDTVPPIDDATLQGWLAAGGYRTLLPESGAHPSKGPHGGQVRTWINGPLARSLEGCSASHPVGAAAVKELHGRDGLRGWAVMVKTRPEPGAGSWYWYEVFDTAPDTRPGYSGQGHDTCTGCHDGGLDAVRTRWPLQ